MKTTHNINISAFAMRGLMAGTAIAALVMANTAHANPLGGVVAAGSATIGSGGPNTLNVNQSSNKAVINWSSFNIAPNETTNFIQPGTSSVALNRIGSANPSQILGSLNANGQLMLVNPNGVFFGKNAKVDTAALLATTTDINNNDFMNGKYAFSRAGKQNGQIVNNGTITVDDGGYVALVGPTATNNGVITANLGKVAIAGTDVFTLDLTGDKLINFSLPNGVTRSGPQGNAGSAANHGEIYADQGAVQLTAKAVKNTVNSLVNMDGLIQANSSKTKKGSVYLSGDDVDISGNIDVSGKNKADGGSVEAHARKYLAFTGDINAEGGPNGGDGGNIWLQSNVAMNLGGTASVGAGGSIQTLDDSEAKNGNGGGNGGYKKPKGGTATFQSGNTFDIYSSEAYTIGDAVSHGGTINVLANDTINVESDIDGTQSAMLEKGNGGGYGNGNGGDKKPNTLNFGDGDKNGDLTINLNGKIKVPHDTKLIGDGTQVNVSDAGSIQNGVDVASTSGADVAVGPGTYDENVTIAKNDINLHGAPGFMTANYSEGGDGGYGEWPSEDKPLIDGYVNIKADNATVDGFKITGGNLGGDDDYASKQGGGYGNGGGNGGGQGSNYVGVNVEHGSNATISNNDIALGDSWYGEQQPSGVADKNGNGGGYGGYGQGTGVKLTDANNATVEGNHITGADTGVSVDDSDNTTVSDNHIHADKTGVKVYDSSNVKVSSNDISGNAWDDGYHPGNDLAAAKNGNGGYGQNTTTVGIDANKAANIKIDGNTIKNADTAIKVKDSANAKITWNTASKVNNGTVGEKANNMVYDHNTVTGNGTNKGDGLLLTNSTNAKVTNNTHSNVKNKLRLVNSNTTVKSGNNF